MRPGATESRSLQRFEIAPRTPLLRSAGNLLALSPDGKTLAYMVVPITTKPAVTVGPAQVVFERAYYRPIPGTRTYSLSKDGTRLLIIKPMKPSNTGDRIHVVLNWFDELRRLLPVD